MSDLSLQQIEFNLKIAFPNLNNMTPIRLLGNGWGSIAVIGNNDFVFRIAKNAIIQEQHKRQVKILPLLKKQLEKIEIPFPEYYIESSQEFPFGVMAYRKIDGKIFNPSHISEKDLEYMAGQVAALLLQFHKTKTSDECVKGLPQADYSQQRLRQTWEKAADWLRKNLTVDEYHAAANWWMEAMLFFGDYHQDTVLVHGDPWYENLLLDEKMNIKGIVDFDKVSLGDKAIDFVVQQYVSQEFMDQVVLEYRKLGGQHGDDFGKRVELLSGIKRVEDLIYCLRTGYLYPTVVKEIKKTLLQKRPVV